MQITHVEVTPIELRLRQPYLTVHGVQVEHTGAIFVRIEGGKAFPRARGLWRGVVRP